MLLNCLLSADNSLDAGRDKPWVMHVYMQDESASR